MEKLILEIQNLSVNIKQRSLLKIKKLQLYEKQIMGIYSPNGSGKTTLLNLIAGCSISKEFEVKGNIINNTPVSYVFQKPVLIESRDVEKNIFMTLNSIENKEKKQDLCRKWIQLLGLDSISKKKVKNLSGGERQRFCIARAFASNQKLMLLDEPFASQDKNNAAKIIDLLIHEKETKDFSAIIVSHDLEKLKKLCDFIITEKDLNYDKDNFGA